MQCPAQHAQQAITAQLHSKLYVLLGSGAHRVLLPASRVMEDTFANFLHIQVLLRLQRSVQREVGAWMASRSITVLMDITAM